MSAALHPLHRWSLTATTAPLFLGAWLVLWVWDRSAYGRFLDHGGWTDAGFGALCAVAPGGSAALATTLYVGGWVLMCTAMMLPTALPLLALYHRSQAGRPWRNGRTGLLAGGYVLAWIAYGGVAHGADWLVHTGIAAVPWLAVNGWALGAAILVIAGLFQFSSLKYACLDKCRTPVGLLLRHQGRRRGPLAPLGLGLWHGLYCVGCCWALMLVMFAVGTASLGVMLGLGVLMALEKNLPGGRRAARPIGFAFLGLAAVTVGVHVAAIGSPGLD